MAKTSTYGHYCAAARALEVIGEKWSLLLVRDLLYGPHRFSDLARSLGGITPKLLTNRLRELEASGVIERDEEEGRREVWYRLTPAGEALRPVVDELLVWGVEHGKPPEPGEPVYPRRGGGSMVAIRGSTSSGVPMWKSAPRGRATSSWNHVPSDAPVTRSTTSPSRKPWVMAW